MKSLLYFVAGMFVSGGISLGCFLSLNPQTIDEFDIYDWRQFTEQCLMVATDLANECSACLNSNSL